MSLPRQRISNHRILIGGGPPSAVPPPPPSTASVEERTIAAMDLGPAFELACAELGFAAAAWLFVEQVASYGGTEAVVALRDELGASFSELDFVASRWIEGERAPTFHTRGLRPLLTGLRRVLVVGIEANHLDVLARELDPKIRLGLLTYRLQRVDWDRVLDNFGGRIEPVDLGDFQSWAGSRSAILTFIYGIRGELVRVLPSFLRLSGPDVRTQFRDIIGWDVLGAPPEVYPRYLVETLSTELTAQVEFDSD